MVREGYKTILEFLPSAAFLRCRKNGESYTKICVEKYCPKSWSNVGIEPATFASQDSRMNNRSNTDGHCQSLYQLHYECMSIHHNGKILSIYVELTTPRDHGSWHTIPWDRELSKRQKDKKISKFKQNVYCGSHGVVAVAEAFASPLRHLGNLVDK